MKATFWQELTVKRGGAKAAKGELEVTLQEPWVYCTLLVRPAAPVMVAEGLLARMKALEVPAP